MPRRIYVYTEASVHIIDPDGLTVRRVPGKGLGLIPPDAEDDLGVMVSALRRDHEELILWKMPNPQVGERMDMLVQVRNDNIITARQTTIVTDVREVWGDE